MAANTIDFHFETCINADDHTLPYFIMGPAAKGGGPVFDTKAYTIYAGVAGWDFTESLPVIYDGLTIQAARAMLLELAHAQPSP
jgi:hypothetical protein